MTLDELLDRGLGGDLRSLGRVLSRVEDGGDDAARILDVVYPRTGRATVIGLTGPPGVGKSTLAAALITAYRRAHKRVAVVAVDPTSPFSGGALLGDRIRMLAHFEDAEVFIRSMATRGHLGGIASATADVVDVLDCAGYDTILVETIGVGQDDVEIASLVATCVLVLTPGQGDEIQALKSGVMEVGDIYLINKSDQDGVDHLETALRSVLSIQGLAAARPIVKTVATNGAGVDALVEAIASTPQRLGGPEMAARELERARYRIETLVEAGLRRLLNRGVAAQDRWEEEAGRVARKESAPYRAAKRLLDQIAPGL